MEQEKIKRRIAEEKQKALTLLTVTAVLAITFIAAINYLSINGAVFFIAVATLITVASLSNTSAGLPTALQGPPTPYPAKSVFD